MSRVAVFALLGLGTLAGCVPAPGDPYGFGYGYAPAPGPYYGGGYAPYFAPAEPTVIVGGGGPDYRYRDQGYRDQGYRDQGYRDQRYRDQAYRNQGYRNERPREGRGPEAPRIVGNTIQNPRGVVPAQGFGGGARPQPNPSTLPGAIPPGRNTMPVGGGP